MKRGAGKSFFLSLIIFLFVLDITAEVEKRAYVIPNENLVLYPNFKSLKIEKSLNSLNIVKLSRKQVELLSESIHKNKFSCGGFIDVQDEVVQKRDLNQILREYDFASLKGARADIPQKVSFQEKGATVLNAISKERYKKFLTDLVSFKNRNGKSDDGVKASQWIADQANDRFKKYNQDNFSIFTVKTEGGYKQDSLVIHLKGQDSTLPAVVSGAHMDSIVSFSATGNQPGADDDGSGSAGVFEVLEALLSSGTKLKRDVYFIFYSAEEWGLVGSKKVVNHFVANKIPVRAVLHMDMIGYKSPKDAQKMYFISDNSNPAFAGFGKEVAKAYLGYEDKDVGSTACGYACSDHASWHKAGFATFFPFEASFSNYNKNIHSVNDTIDKLDFDHAVSFVKLTAATLTEMAEPL